MRGETSGIMGTAGNCGTARQGTGYLRRVGRAGNCGAARQGTGHLRRVGRAGNCGAARLGTGHLRRVGTAGKDGRELVLSIENRPFLPLQMQS